MNAWTPGPWEVSYAHDGTGYPRFAIHGMAGEAKRDKHVLEANAHLIASAPIMAEYIKRKADAGDSEALAIWEQINGH